MKRRNQDQSEEEEPRSLGHMGFLKLQYNGSLKFPDPAKFIVVAMVDGMLEMTWMRTSQAWLSIRNGWRVV